MKVLVACEESQTVTKAFRSIGIEAWSCDIQDCSGGRPEWHIKGDALREAYSGKYDLMIGHPPCDFLSKCGGRWLYKGGKKVNGYCPKRTKGRSQAVQFFLELWNAPIRFICLENPADMLVNQPVIVDGVTYKLSDRIPECTQVVEPFHHGHGYSKKTGLWLKNLPLLEATDIVDEYVPYMPSNTGGAKRGHKATPKTMNKKLASKTFEGIAKAMANQWSLLS